MALAAPPGVSFLTASPGVLLDQLHGPRNVSASFL